MVSEAEIREALTQVMDPEIPVISVIDLGIITRIKVQDKHSATIYMTPTFTGCPAIDLMKEQIKEKVQSLGLKQVNVHVDRETTWNSNMISQTGKQKLESLGLGSPAAHDGEVTPSMVAEANCPRCKGSNTSIRSPFGSALCRSIHYCFDCGESFERFKPL